MYFREYVSAPDAIFNWSGLKNQENLKTGARKSETRLSNLRGENGCFWARDGKITR